MEEVAANILSNLPSWFGVLMKFAVLGGLIMVGLGLIEVGKASKGGGRASYGRGVASIIIGSLMASLQAFFDAASQTAWAAPSMSSLYSSSQVSGAGIAASVVASVTLFFAVVQLVGLYSEIKGLRLLRDSATEPDKAGAAWTHIIGGVFALNILTVIHIVANTAGTSVSGIVNTIIGAG